MTNSQTKPPQGNRNRTSTFSFITSAARLKSFIWEINVLFSISAKKFENPFIRILCNKTKQNRKEVEKEYSVVYFQSIDSIRRTIKFSFPSIPKLSMKSNKKTISEKTQTLLLSKTIKIDHPNNFYYISRSLIVFLSLWSSSSSKKEKEKVNGKEKFCVNT